jgi:hypothetical protein
MNKIEQIRTRRQQAHRRLKDGWMEKPDVTTGKQV